MRRAFAVIFGIITFVVLFPALASSSCPDGGGGCVESAQALVGLTYTGSWILPGVAVAMISGIGVGLGIWSFGGRD